MARRLFARVEIDDNDQRRLGRIGAFDYAVAHLRERLAERQEADRQRPFAVTLEHWDQPPEGGQIERDAN